jgi:hypothetical protein
MSRSYLLILGDREAIGWVLTTGCMAFRDRNRSGVSSLRVGDWLYVYSTRKAFGNPTRDRGRLIGTAIVGTEVSRLARPVTFGGRDYSFGCDLKLDSLVPLGDGVELAPLVPVLETLSSAGRGWPSLLRRPLLRLSPNDAEFLSGELTNRLDPTRPPAEVIEEYSYWYRKRQE